LLTAFPPLTEMVVVAVVLDMVPSLSTHVTVRVGLAPELVGLAPAWNVALSSTCW
jgi:hypothetical protein